ncbi:MAG: hypothetical protein QXV17_00480 [Candidatus Micrarchaeaceae archaeon]
MMDKTIWYIIAVIIIVGIIIYVAITPAHVTTISSLIAVPILLTDPPHLPAGATSLNISYSSLRVHYIGSANASGWLDVSSSGTINLMHLINFTEVIGVANLPINSSINIVQFNITSASITINGTAYPVTVPKQQVSAKIAANGRLNATSGLLADLSPTVVTIYTTNSTIFVLVPSLKAVVVPSVNASAKVAGNISKLAYAYKHEIESIKPNLTVISKSLEVGANGTTSISITIKDNSNKSATINHIMLFGNESVTLSKIAVPMQPFSIGQAMHFGPNTSEISGILGIYHSNNITKAFITNANVMNVSSIASAMISEMEDHGVNISNSSEISAYISKYTSRLKNEDFGMNNNFSMMVNSSSLGEVEDHWGNVYNNWRLISQNASALGLNISQFSEKFQEMAAMRIKFEQQYMRVLNFIVESNGTLALPFNSDQMFEGNVGYVLAPGSQATFSFSGKIEYANGHVIITPIPGATYKVVLIGEEGAYATTNVTAS